MAAAPLPPPDPMRVSARRRVGGVVLAVAANLLLLALLLGLTPLTDRRPPPADRGPITFDLSSEAGGAAARPKPVEQQRRPQKVQATPREAARVATPPDVPVEAEAETPLPMILLTPEQFAASDIGRMPRGRGAGAGEQSAARGAGGSDASVGTAPNGEKLYQAEWYREPTHAELAGYIPQDAPPEGWGLVACRTIPGNRVEDCAEIGESPQGSKLARAVRLAAWQFRVRPPRVGGKPLVGGWVRIRIDYSRRNAGAEGL